MDIGCEQRTIVSECKYVMDVEDAVGKKVLFVANLPPTEVNGVMSHGKHFVCACRSFRALDIVDIIQCNLLQCWRFD